MKIQSGEELFQVSQVSVEKGRSTLGLCLCAWSEHTHEAAVGQEAKKLCYDTVPVC